METAVALLCIIAFCLATRLPFSFVQSTDNWLTYLLLVTNGSKKCMDLKMPLAMTGKDNGEAIMPYPALAHFLASRLPQRFWKIGALSITYLSDALTACLVYLALTRSLPELGLNPNQVAGVALPASLSMLCLPILLPITARVKAPNGRALGLLTTTLCFIFLWLALNVSAWFVLAAVLFAFLSILASKFSMQVLFFFIPIMALLLKSPLLLVPLGAVVLVVLAMPRSVVASLCVDKIVHALRYKIVDSTAEHRNLFKSFVDYFRFLFSDYRKSALLLRRWAPLPIVLVGIPYVFLILPTPLFGSGKTLVLDDPALSFAYALILAAFVVFLLTSTGPLRVFGQSERYFEYAAPFVVFFVAAYAAKCGLTGPGTAWLMLGLNLLLVLFLHVSTNFPFLDRLTRFDFGDDPELKEVLAFLAGLDAPRVGAVPIKLNYILMGMAAQKELHGPHYYHPTMSTVPVRISSYRPRRDILATPFVPSNDPAWVKERFGIDTWVEDVAFADENADQPFVRALREQKPVFNTERFRVYRV